jgi:hypothetical protein
MNAGGGSDTPPDIPPSSTFVMEFGDFSAEGGTGKTIDGVDPTSAQLIPTSNWLWSAGQVTAWNLVQVVTLAIPVGAYGEAFNHVPTFDSDTGAWIWSYDFVAAGVTHSAALHATTAGGNIEWDMFISKDGEYTDVNWYSGLSNLVGTSGTWRLNRDPQNVTPFIDIEWNRDPTTGAADIRYTNVVPDGPENGGYIFLEVLVDTENDRHYQIFNRGADNLIDIEWSAATKAGRVMDPAHFGDEAWHCWDGGLQNIDCVEPG